MSRILEFFKENAEDIVKTIPAPAYSPSLEGVDSELNKFICEKLAYLRLNENSTREPFPGQVEYVIAPIVKLLEKERTGIIVGKQGTGKTTMSNSIAYILYEQNYKPKNKGFKTGMFVSGSKHMKKMKREAESLFGNSVDVYSVVSKPRKTVSWEITIEEAAKMPRVPGRISYFLISKDTGKNTYKYKAMKSGDKCPKCFHRLYSRVGKKNEVWRCSYCSEKTYQVVSGKESYPDKLKRMQKNKHDKFFDFFIIDEVHEFANRDSLQSRYYKTIVNVSYKSIVMTGTLSNGFASSIFYILYPLFSEHFREYGGFTYEKVSSFVNLFGSIKESSEAKVYENKGSKGRPKVSIQELPQISDRIISFLAPYTVWFDISDLNVDMPNFKEIQKIVPLDLGIQERFEAWKRKIMEVKSTGDMEVIDYNLFRFSSSISYRINNPTKLYTHEILARVEIDRELELSGDNEDNFIPLYEEKKIYVEFEPLSESFLSNKERELIEVCKQELSEGRRILVYGVYNNSTNLYDRLHKVLEMEGIESEITPDKLKSENIEEWLRSSSRANIVFVPQKRVATGLDLVEYHTIIFYEIDKELKTVSQAKVRPWRPVGQTKEVRVYYLAFEGLQANLLQRMAQKMRAAAVVDGEVINNNTIAAIYDYNPELTAAIRNISQRINNMETNVLKRKHSELEQYYIDCVNDCKKKLSEIKNNIITSEEVAEVAEVAEEVVEEVVEEVAIVTAQTIEVFPIEEIVRSINSYIDEIEAKNNQIEVAVVEDNGQQAWLF